MTIQGHA